ncbi:MAG: dynamin family protein [Verrucomicrobiota bacterium]|nr:dynamin family protein [Verrucomicrobiota bacterium]
MLDIAEPPTFNGFEERPEPRVLGPDLSKQYEALRVLLQRSLWLAEKCADFDATQILRTRLANLQAAALIVVVGEVKAGKSSFINALVHEEVCPVAPGPCTAAIQELVYGREQAVTNMARSWERVFLPKEVLREVTMVDTPGTNSIIHDHQTLTEKYIPQSDLVVFVFSAVNPHTKTSWELLTLVRKEWHRKTVFVLQQADRASLAELETNREHVRQYARARHVADPAIFTLSAKLEKQGSPDSGFAEFRHFLQTAVAHGEVWRIKVEGCYETVRTVMTKLDTHFRAEGEAIVAEREFYQRLLKRVEAREATAMSIKQLIIDKLCGTYDRLAAESERDFTEGLQIGKLFRRAVPFLRDKDLETWIAQLESGLQESTRKQIEVEAPGLSKDLFDEIQAMLDEVTQSIARREEGIRENANLPQTTDRLAILERLRMKLDRIRVGDEIATDKIERTTDVRRFAFAGAGVAVVGLAIAVLSENNLLWATGVIFAGLGVALVAIGLLWRRTAVLRDFHEKIGDSRKEFRDRLEAEFNQIFDGLFYDVRQALAETIFRLELQSSHVAPLLQEIFRNGQTASEMLFAFQQNLAAPSVDRI